MIEQGKVECSEETGVFIISGLVNEVSDTQIEITDIPPTQTIKEYKQFFVSLRKGAIVKVLGNEVNFRFFTVSSV